jgi:thiol:disulfide interchange protein DsbD
MQKTRLLILAVLIIVSLVFAQEENQIIRARFMAPVNAFVPGQSYPLAVEIFIRKPYHVNSNKPEQDFLIPTSLTFQAPEGVAFGKVEYPQAKMKKFAFSDTPLSVYDGNIFVFTTISISPGITAQDIELKARLDYQACDDQTCQAPAELMFSQAFSLTADSTGVTAINQDIFKQQNTLQQTEEVIKPSQDSSIAGTISQKGWIITFLLVFLGGLALNLTPCVYPLIPITISYFGGQTEGRKGSLLLHAIIYVLGMAITYSILGVIAALTGSLFGAALQNSYVLIVIAVILVGLALSMFDLYEIRVPAFLSNFAGGAKQGVFGTFFMGLTVGIVAAPCIGPFVLALLTFVGERGDVLLGFWMFFVLAIGLGIPFIFLAVFSGSLHKIPRSGAWMVWVRTIFGFILVAMAVYFLEPLFPGSLSYFLTLAVVMLIGGIYMAWLEPTQTGGKVFKIIRNLMGVVFFVVAIFFATTGIQAGIDQAVASKTVSSSETTPANAINWLPYTKERIARAAADKKPVIMDFYADWCIPCKELEKFTFSDPEVIKLSSQFVMLKVDLTHTADPLSRQLRQEYGIKGVPTLVFLSEEGKELKELRVVGFVDKDEFLPVMKKTLQATEQEAKE